MKCKNCGYEAPERAVICPECGEILPRSEQSAGAAETAEAAGEPNTFSMPFLSADAGSSSGEGIGTEDPALQQEKSREKRFRRIRWILCIAIAAVLLLGVTLYQVFLGSYKLAAYRYVKGVDRCSGSMYAALVPDEFMDYLENTYSTTRREVKENLHDYFVYWNENFGTEGSMSYDLSAVSELEDEDALAELEAELKNDYSMTVEIKKAVTARITIDDGGTKATEQATFVKIGFRWCCIEAMEDVDFVCENDGYGVW